jgi:transcriptional regulator of acetoin/glycerol metabolism
MAPRRCVGLSQGAVHTLLHAEIALRAGLLHADARRTRGVLTNHPDRVLESVHSREQAAYSTIAASWRRCFARHRLDPGQRNVGVARDSQRLRHQIDNYGRLVRLAEARLEDLLRMLSHTGRAVFLTDADGLVLMGRNRSADADLFEQAGLVAGADWSEAVQGTNGIGTCLTEARPVIIHRDQHYLAQNTAMSCIDAPVFGPDGKLLAALDVSSARTDDSEGFNQLIAAMIGKVAFQIETDLFRDVYAGRRIVQVDNNDVSPVLVAVDQDDVVIGATRAARRRFGMTMAATVRPVPLRDLSGEDPLGLEGAERAAIVRALTRNGGNASATARELEMGRATLYRRMKRLGLGQTGRDLSQD